MCASNHSSHVCGQCWQRRQGFLPLGLPPPPSPVRARDLGVVLDPAAVGMPLSDSLLEVLTSLRTVRLAALPPTSSTCRFVACPVRSNSQPLLAVDNYVVVHADPFHVKTSSPSWYVNGRVLPMFDDGVGVVGIEPLFMSMKISSFTGFPSMWSDS